jgi:hypothetical protein
MHGIWKATSFPAFHGREERFNSGFTLDLLPDIYSLCYTSDSEIFHERVHQMRITEMSRLAGASTDELRYMERKGFLSSGARILKSRQVRDYPESEVRKAGLIVKYRKLGFTWDAAFKKAQEELANPPLFPDS